jgi:adenosylhomocysteine nucleosidase
MIYLITALDAEARALVDYYRLKRDTSLPYTLYRNEQMVLLVCGMGKPNALMAVSALLGWRIPQENDILLNIGICAAPSSYGIGEVLLIHQIMDADRRYYPDILYTHSLREASVICVDAPQSTPCNHPVDMESSAIFQAASRFFKLHQMAFIKIVSDHFSPQSVTKEGVIELICTHINVIDILINNLKLVQIENSLFTDEEREKIEAVKGYFTKSQGDALEDALIYFRLKNDKMPLPLTLIVPNSKRERSQQLETLLTTLTA